MKCMIAFSCLLAVASAGYLGNVASYSGAYDDGSYKGEFYNGLYGGAVAYANQGTPAVAYNAPLVSAPHPVHVAHAYAAPFAHGYGYAHGYAHGHVGLASEARLIDPVAIAAGAPLPGGDTVEVAAAKAFHHQAHVAAKSGHLLAKGLGYSSPIVHGYGHVGLASEARLVDPVAIAAGAPLPGGDTVEVAAAKAFHHQAHHDAKVGHLHAKGHYLGKRSPILAYASPIHSYGYTNYASPLAYSGYSGYGYGGHYGAYYG